MKAAANGALNLSVLDGWWIEGCDEQNGWGLPNEIRFENQDQQNRLDNEILMRLLEDEVLPLFHDRDADGMPLEWLRRSLHALDTLPAFFSTDRMVRDYAERAYAPRAASALKVVDNGFTGARERAQEHKRLRNGFRTLEILDARVGDLGQVRTGDAVQVELDVRLDSLAPEDVCAELILGHALSNCSLQNTQIVSLVPVEQIGDVWTFRGEHTVRASGTYSWGMRVRPRGGVKGDLSLRGYVRWA